MIRQGREGGREGFRRGGGKKKGDARVGNEVRVWSRSGSEKGRRKNNDDGVICSTNWAERNDL